MIILASQSPRRIQILTENKLEFKAVSPTWDESKLNSLNWRSYATTQAYFKALSVLNDSEHLKQNDLILATDTIVVSENMILGKPNEEDACLEMLKKLNGKKHKVVSGVALIYKNKVYSFKVITQVYFKQNTDTEIKKYIEKARPFDKAGGYGIQDKENTLIKKTVGDYQNVVGMPSVVLNKIKEIYKWAQK